MKKIIVAAFSCWTLFSFSLYAQGLNLTFESNAPNESLANHRPWENSNIEILNGSNVAVWGTTIEDGNGDDAVYIQTFETAVSGTVNIGFDRQYQVADPFDPASPLGPTQFHGLEEDGNQIVVAATRDWLNVGNNTRFVSIFSLERSSGNVLWTQSLQFGDAMRMDDMQIIRDNAGDFVVAFNLESQLPKWGPVSHRSGLGIVKIDPNGVIQWVQEYRYPGNTYIPNLYRLMDLKQNSLSNGTAPYILTGGYSRNGPNETAFVLMLDNNGNLFNGLSPRQANLRPGPEDYLSVTTDGNRHYLGYATANQQIGLQTFNNNYGLGFFFVLPQVLGKNQVLSRELKAGNGFINLMLEYQEAGGIQSPGYGRLAPVSNSFAWSYRFEEYDYSPGDKESIPLGYIEENGDRLFLTEPSIASGAMGYPLQSYLRVLQGENPAGSNSCHPTNSGSLSIFPSFIFNSWPVLNLIQTNFAEVIFTKPAPSDYAGTILDCNLNPFANYRVAGEGENVLLPKINLFPNPASSAVQLEGDLSNYDSLEILDMTGRVVWQGAVKNKVSVSDLSPGIYHLRLSGLTAVQNLSFVKTN
ncbi:MAG: T9SS type A sorting domain-containing protein [Bacteroidia bacterium]